MYRMLSTQEICVVPRVPEESSEGLVRVLDRESGRAGTARLLQSQDGKTHDV